MITPQLDQYKHHGETFPATNCRNEKLNIFNNRKHASSAFIHKTTEWSVVKHSPLYKLLNFVILNIEKGMDFLHCEPWLLTYDLREVDYV